MVTDSIDQEWDFNSYLLDLEKKLALLSVFGFVEAYKTGALDFYRHNQSKVTGFSFKIPWSTTGPNPCPYCRSLDGELFDVDDFPGPPHPRCRCNIPMAPPVIIRDRE